MCWKGMYWKCFQIKEWVTQRLMGLRWWKAFYHNLLCCGCNLFFTATEGLVTLDKKPTNTHYPAFVLGREKVQLSLLSSLNGSNGYLLASAFIVTQDHCWHDSFPPITRGTLLSTTETIKACQYHWKTLKERFFFYYYSNYYY